MAHGRWCLLLSLPHLDLRPAKGLLRGAEGIPEGHGQSGDPDAHLKPQPLCLLSPWLLSSSPHSGPRVSLPRSPGLRPLLPCLSARSENNCFLYGVFNGYDGNRVTNFVAQRLSAELLLGQLNAEHTEADVRRVLLQVPGSGGPTDFQGWPRDPPGEGLMGVTSHPGLGWELLSPGRSKVFRVTPFFP